MTCMYTKMATRRKSANVSSNSNYNFRPQNDSQKRGEGTKPLPDPVSVGGALLMMVIHVCRRIMFFKTHLKLTIYLAVIFLSIVFDSYPLPKSYFSRSSNALNQYFVKLGWAWTLIVTLPFVLITSFTYCCGNRRMVGFHLLRIVVATVNWFVFTKSFVYFENNTGRCSVKPDKFLTKQSCLAGGHFWHSLDISGHSFILIYSALVIIEEAKVIIGWETIDNLIINENYTRSNNESDLRSPLKSISNDELKILKLSFKTFTPWVRGIFIAMTLLVCLWDLMILSTALYFHTMVEKLISAFIAISVWFITYRLWYQNTSIMPCAPGEGLFQYNKPKVANGVPLRATPRQRPDLGPTFMGMPLASKNQTAEEEEEVPTISRLVNNSSTKYSPTSPPLRTNGPITRSQSRFET